MKTILIIIIVGASTAVVGCLYVLFKLKKLRSSLMWLQKDINFTEAIVYASIAHNQNIPLKEALAKHPYKYTPPALDDNQCRELAKLIPARFNFNEIREVFPKEEQ